MNINNNFVEPSLDNKEASRYIEQHYKEILNNIAKMGVCLEKQEDLLNDVYVSLVEAEENGEGFDMYKVDKPILVSNFVYGRIKKYSNNPRYRTDLVDYRAKGKNSKSIVVKASNNSMSGTDELDEFQAAYMNATDNCSSLDEIEDKLSIRSKIEFCTEFNHTIGIDVISLFKNINLLDKISVCESMFTMIREAFKLHDEFALAFVEVIEFAKSNTEEFDSIMATV